jgi:hypothetical protein
MEYHYLVDSSVKFVRAPLKLRIPHAIMIKGGIKSIIFQMLPKYAKPSDLS